MAKREGQKVKGCRKCGRTKRKNDRKGSTLSLFVRGKINATEYFKATNQSVKRAG